MNSATTYTRPPPESLPAELAKEMGWNESESWWYLEGKPWVNEHKMNWKPLSDRNKSFFAVKKCSELGLKDTYEYWLEYEQQKDVYLRILATPSQESYAAHRTLFDHNQKRQLAMQQKKVGVE